MKTKEIIKFAFKTEQNAMDFYQRRLQIFKTDKSDLNMYEVENLGWIVEVNC